MNTAQPDTVFVAEVAGQVAGGVITNAIGSQVQDIEEGCDPVIVPLIELENCALNTHYINALAVFHEFQRQWIGAALLHEIERRHPDINLSLIVEDTNVSARRLYEREGYLARDTAPICRGGWETDAQTYILMIWEH